MSDTPTLPVCPHDKIATKVRCAHCRQQFEPKSTGRPPKFCGDPCRIAAWRKPGKDRKLQQRNIRFERLNRDRSLSICGYSGPAVSGVPESDSIRLTSAAR